MDSRRIETIRSSQEPERKYVPSTELVGERIEGYQIWANLVDVKFTKTVYYYKVKLTCVDEEKAEFTISIEKDYNLRQKVLSEFGIYNKLQEMFLGRYVYNDTLVKVIETVPDKSFEHLFTHEGETYNLECAIELQGEKNDQRSVLAYCRDILHIFQKNVIKYQRFGKNSFFDPATRENIRGAELIDTVTGLDMNMNVYKPHTLKMNLDFKVATVFNRDVTYFLREQFQRHDEVTYDQLMKALKDRKYHDNDGRFFLDDLIPKKEVYTPQEVMNMHAVMYRSLRNMKFKRDPQTFKLSSLYFTVENKDAHTQDTVKMAVKRKQMKDFQFQTFCNNTLFKMREHWIFKENGILFAPEFNRIPIERQLSAKIQLGGGEIVSTHNNGIYDRNYNNHYKNISSRCLHIQKGSLDNWTIIYESTIQGIKQKIDAMIEKFQRQLGRAYNVQICTPNVVEVRDLQGYEWRLRDQEIVMVVLNSKVKKDVLSRKYEMVKYNCHKHGDMPNQVILSKTFEQPDFIKLVTLNLMYDIIMKLPNTMGHRVIFDNDMSAWLNGKTMVFAMDVCHKRGYKSVASILSYTTSDMTYFRTDYLVKDEEMSELKYSDECKQRFKEIIKKCICDYEFHNKSQVSRVVFLRDAVTDPQRRVVDTTEIAYLNEVFSELGREHTQLYYLTASKRISTKIFEFNQRDNKLNHLESGIYIDRSIVKDALPSFYLNSSNNRLSKCCFYECLYPKQIEIQEDFDKVMSLIYKLSFMYFHGYNLANISVPGLLKYAEKKASFYSIIESLKRDEEDGKSMFDTRSENIKRKRD